MDSLTSLCLNNTGNNSIQKNKNTSKINTITTLNIKNEKEQKIKIISREISQKNLDQILE